MKIKKQVALPDYLLDVIKQFDSNHNEFVSLNIGKTVPTYEAASKALSILKHQKKLSFIISHSMRLVMYDEEEI